MTDRREGIAEDAARSREWRGHSRSLRVGKYRGWPVHLGVSQTPKDADVPDEFAVNLFVPNPDGENVDIARIDTAHAGCHIDRLYLPTDHPERREDYGIQYATPAAAVAHFIRDETWAYYARRYDEVHGLPEETRVYD